MIFICNNCKQVHDLSYIIELFNQIKKYFKKYNFFNLNNSDYLINF